MLGATRWDAAAPVTRDALRSALMPTINSMAATGLVSLPGMMTGQILAGTSPLLAIRYQIVVVCMQAVATAVGALLLIRMMADRYLTTAHQLRRYLL